MADEPDHPNVFVAIAFPSTESLNWDGHRIKEDGKFQNPMTQVAQSGVSRSSGPWQPLRNRTFRNLLASNLISDIGILSISP